MHDTSVNLVIAEFCRCFHSFNTVPNKPVYSLNPYVEYSTTTCTARWVTPAKDVSIRPLALMHAMVLGIPSEIALKYVVHYNFLSGCLSLPSKKPSWLLWKFSKMLCLSARCLWIYKCSLCFSSSLSSSRSLFLFPSLSHSSQENPELNPLLTELHALVGYMSQSKKLL